MNPPGSSEGARLDTGRPTTTNTATARPQVLGHPTARIWHVVPDAHTVVGRSGNTRLILRVGCYVLEMRGAVE